MLIPTKHEKLSQNILVVGANLINILKKEALNIEYLYITLSKNKKVSLNVFYDTITFLWLSEIVIYKDNIIFLRKDNETC